MSGHTKLLFLTLGLLANSAALVLAEEASKPIIAARVGDEAIEVTEARRLMEAVFEGKMPTGAMLPMARAQVLEEIISRRLVVAYAQRTGAAPGSQEIAKAKKHMQSQLAAQGRKVADVLKAERIAEADLERQVVWRLVWDGYLAKYRTAQRRASWFKEHHRELDGTELTVSHILLQAPAGAGSEAIAELTNKAASIREEIASGKLDFAAAAKQYSAGPSRERGGKLGTIRRQEPMDESFSRAAFALKAGEISPPIRSPFGVHLIRCDGVASGTKQIEDVVGRIDEALAKELLLTLSELERKHTPVGYTSAWPHFKPGTRELDASLSATPVNRSK